MARITIDDIDLLFKYLDKHEDLSEKYFCDVKDSSFSHIIGKDVTLGTFLDCIVEYADKHDIDANYTLFYDFDISYYYNIKYKDTIIEIALYNNDEIYICNPVDNVVDPIDLEAMLNENPLDEIFNVANYRKHLETYYKYDIDKGSPKMKEYIDKYSDGELQKIVDDTKTFAFYILNGLRNTEHLYEGEVWVDVYLGDEKSIFTNLSGGWSSDVLYSFTSFDKDFFVSYHLLTKFLKCRIEVCADEIEHYFGDEDAGYIEYIPFMRFSMNQKQLEEYDNLGSNGDNKIKEPKNILPN